MKFSTVIASTGLVSCLVSSAANASDMPQDHARQLQLKFRGRNQFEGTNRNRNGVYYGPKIPAITPAPHAINYTPAPTSYKKPKKSKKSKKTHYTPAPTSYKKSKKSKKSKKTHYTPAPTSYTPAPTSYTPAPTSYKKTHHDDGYGTCTAHCAVDDKTYPKCNPPRVSPVDNLREVSVCGDATYKLPASVAVDDICSGDGDAPSGTICPMKGAETTTACRENIISYMTGAQKGKTGTCVAPEAATCQKLLSGAWGCVFPGNCNTRNTCLGEEACSDEYEKDAHGKCVIGPNHYPVAAAHYTGTVDTTVVPELPIETSELSASGTVALAVSGMIGLITVGTFVISTM